eukprot:s3558_g2.t6
MFAIIFLRLQSPGLMLRNDSTVPLRKSGSNWQLLVFAWCDGRQVKELSLELPGSEDQQWHVFEFWSGAYYSARASLGLGPVEARCGRLLALRPRLDQADYLGSNIHVSCGREVEDGSQRLRFRLCVGRRVADPKVWLFLPGCREPPYGAAEAKEVASEVWCVPLPMIPKQGAAFSLSWPSSRNSLTKTELSLNA